MGIEDGLDVFGNPALDLPMDIGDGPFASAMPTGDMTRPAFAQIEERFRRTTAFEEGLLTRGSDRIAVGQIYIGDTVPANSFRRVHQHFSLRSVRQLNGRPLIRFWGDPLAIIEEGTGKLAPGPQGNTSVQRAIETLEGVNELVRPTMSIQTSLFQIRFRLPGYEPVNAQGMSRGVQDPAESMTPAPGIALAGTTFSANRVETFPFSNSGGSIKEFTINYPVGDSVPIIFDIVNHNPIYAIQCAFSVFVLVDRSED